MEMADCNMLNSQTSSALPTLWQDQSQLAKWELAALWRPPRASALLPHQSEAVLLATAPSEAAQLDTVPYDAVQSGAVQLDAVQLDAAQ